LASVAGAGAADFPVTFTKNGDSFRLTLQQNSAVYFGVHHTADLLQPFTTIAMALGTPGPVFEYTPDPGETRGFFRLEGIPMYAPADSDFDGMDDVWELQHPTYLDPLDSADGFALSPEPDAAGMTNLEYYRYRFGLGTNKPQCYSREVSLFNHGAPIYAVEAISREVSVFPPVDAVAPRPMRKPLARQRHSFPSAPHAKPRHARKDGPSAWASHGARSDAIHRAFRMADAFALRTLLPSITTNRTHTMKTHLTLTFAAVALWSFSGGASAQIINGSFEDGGGSLLGWSTIGVTSATSATPATHGTFQALMTNGSGSATAADLSAFFDGVVLPGSPFEESRRPSFWPLPRRYRSTIAIFPMNRPGVLSITLSMSSMGWPLPWLMRRRRATARPVFLDSREGCRTRHSASTWAPAHILSALAFMIPMTR
jgi:hypothetical protein